MKIKIATYLVLVFCFCAVQNVFAQNDTDADKKLTELTNNWHKLRSKQSNRQTATIEIFDGESKTLKKKIVSIYEFVPPDRNYYLTTIEEKGTTQKIEAITIGENGFVRKNSGKWEVDNSKPQYGTAAASMPTVRMLEKTTLNGQEVSVYEEKYQLMSENRESNIITRFFFNKDGYLLKREDEESNKKTNEFSKVTGIYEYDSNIKIEAPKLVSSKP